jgi:Ni/Fe-hydrogenase 1 B-type cytochrome subunit
MDARPHAEYFQVYVWELPLRFFHWINAGCVFVLGVTGLLIGSPLPWEGGAAEASSRYLFGSIRFIHFIFGYIFLVNFLGRIYWGFAGNDFAKWKSFVPNTGCAGHLPGPLPHIFLICKLPVLSTGPPALADHSLHVSRHPLQILTGFALFDREPGLFPLTRRLIRLGA